MIWSADAYLKAVNFASRHHVGFFVIDTDEPYLRHLVSVAAEVMTAIAERGDVERPDLAVQCALLHDCVEDTHASIDELREVFGLEVAEGVRALTKSKLMWKPDRLEDSLRRIREQPKEVWMVKLADRIANLQAPPESWSADKINAYRRKSKLIHEQLGDACPVLGPRLLAKLETYAPGS